MVSLAMCPCFLYLGLHLGRCWAESEEQSHCPSYRRLPVVSLLSFSLGPLPFCLASRHMPHPHSFTHSFIQQTSLQHPTLGTLPRGPRTQWKPRGVLLKEDCSSPPWTACSLARSSCLCRLTPLPASAALRLCRASA